MNSALPTPIVSRIAVPALYAPDEAAARRTLDLPLYGLRRAQRRVATSTPTQGRSAFKDRLRADLLQILGVLDDQAHRLPVLDGEGPPLLRERYKERIVFVEMDNALFP